MTKHLATFFLASGLFIMLLPLKVTPPSSQAEQLVINTMPRSSNCLYCHLDAHRDDTIASNLHLVHSPTTAINLTDRHHATAANNFCSSCHQMGEELEFSDTEIQAQIETIQTRVSRLRSDLKQVYNENPHWDLETNHLAKPTKQRIAERITALVQFVEADGSWGFHQPGYTEEILTEAENLMTTLHNMLSQSSASKGDQ